MTAYEKAKLAIDGIFSDSSVTKEQTKQDLESLKDEIDIYLDALETDPG